MIKEGMYVTHIHRKEWGVGKVLEGRHDTLLRLWFELGGERKIGAEYHDMLREVPKPDFFLVPSVKSSPPKATVTNKFSREYFSGRWEFPFSQAERERFKRGHLVHQWAERYPFLFDAEDVAAALAPSGKGGGGYSEWAAAVRLFEARGYHSILQGYASPANSSKHQRVRAICGQENADFMAAAAATCRFPDLMVYTPDHTEWFFSEVKAPGDIVRKSEDTFFPKLAGATGAGIFLVILSLR